MYIHIHTQLGGQRWRAPPGTMADLDLGTDFSGMEVVRVALYNCGFNVRQRFRCESNLSCRKLLRHVFNDVEMEFSDVTQRGPDDPPSRRLNNLTVP